MAEMRITNKYGPNTTILLPGSCSAKCDFCFWNRKEALIKPPENYLDKVDSTLLALPDEFRVLSISGGEPTESPWFGKLLARLAKTRRFRKFDRVVLTTNGHRLPDYIGTVGCVVDHINISRHGIGTEANNKIFGTTNIPSDEELKAMISTIHGDTDCDVTLNCVIDGNTTTRFCFEFIDYARSLGADAVSFRKVASNVNPTHAEKLFSTWFGIKNETDCPVCRGIEQEVNGFPVRWKGSVNEPSIETRGIYELVIHPDGNLYADWGMNLPVDIVPKNVIPPRQPSRSVSRGCGSGGCGSSVSSGCGSGGC